jgi:hypothetical protein
MIHRRAVRRAAPAALGLTVQSDEIALKGLLRDLAAALLPLGITPKVFASASREAFVTAAAASARLRNGKINQSRVSAQTGITRAEVRRILTADHGRSLITRDKAPTEAARVGWKSDPAFVDRLKRPKQLPITGHRGSFASLAKKYAPDIPHRALLRELERIGAVVVSDDKVRLTLPTTKRRRDRALADRKPIESIQRFRFGQGDRSDSVDEEVALNQLLEVLASFKRGRPNARAIATRYTKLNLRAPGTTVTVILSGHEGT